MYILLLIIFIQILNLKGFGKFIAKVMRSAGLQCLAVMHQAFKCVGA
jgi:hypothetical protein